MSIVKRDSLVNNLEYDEIPSAFEGAMITTEKYRQTMYDEMGILNIKFALLLLKDEPQMSKEFANYAIKFVLEKLHYTEGNAQKSFKRLGELLDLITQDQIEKVDINEGLAEITVLNDYIKNNLHQAKARYYKIFKQY